MIVKVFNSFNESIQFTVEIEKDRKIAFLDLWIIRSEAGSIKTDWHHKETWSGRYLNFDSNMPFSYKRNTIKILTDKIIQLSDPEFHKKNFELMTNTLVNNGYPKKFIRQTVERTLDKIGEKRIGREKTDEKGKFIAIPYVKGLFEQIKAIFQDTDKTIVGKGTNNLNSHVFSRLKDKIPKLQQSHVVYNIPCSCELRYVGETKNRLKTREDAHNYNIKIGNANHSALCEHAIRTKHTPKWDEVEILFKDRNHKSRQIKEMIGIKKTQNNVNKKTDTLFLSTIYNDLLGLNEEKNSTTTLNGNPTTNS